MATTRTRNYDERGARVLLVAVTFSAGGSADDWKTFAHQTGMSFKYDDDDPSFWRFGATALPAAESPDEKYLEAWAHEGNEPNTVHWHLELRGRQVRKPPRNIVEMSKRVGGRETLLVRIADLWPAEKSVAARVSVTYMLDRKRWQLLLSTARRKSLSADEKIVARSYAASWRLEPKSGPVESVATMGTIGQAYAVEASGDLELEITPALFDAIDQAIFGGLEAFLIPREHVAP